MYKKKIYKTWFLVPALFIYCVFFILPVVVGIGSSFTNWNSMSSEIKFVGLRNYIEIFNPKNSYLLAIKNTFVFTVFATTGKIVIGLALALFFNSRTFSKKIQKILDFYENRSMISCELLNNHFQENP